MFDRWKWLWVNRGKLYAEFIAFPFSDKVQILRETSRNCLQVFFGCGVLSMVLGQHLLATGFFFFSLNCTWAFLSTSMYLWGAERGREERDEVWRKARYMYAEAQRVAECVRERCVN